VGFKEELLSLFKQIEELVHFEKPGYQQICAGLVISIMGLIMSIKKSENFEGKEIEKVIRKSCLIIRDNLDNNLNMEELAGELNIGYSNFRQMFKKYTGLSPVQYHISLRIQRARDLLSNTELSVKEMAYQLGFSSIDYFSRIFKNKTGKCPTTYRNLHKTNQTV
jgi:transcriptional regulator GlxA family with amidase domain